MKKIEFNKMALIALKKDGTEYLYSENNTGFSFSRKVILFFITLLVLCVMTVNCSFAVGVSKKSSKADIDIEFQTKDNFLLHGKLALPKEKRAKYPLVVLLHSIGYSSKYWGNIQPQLVNAGFAVLSIDFRGHGASIYTAGFKKKNWLYMSDKSYLEYPTDILSFLVYVNDNYKNVSISHMAIVGADIGANTAILVADKLKIKPEVLVLISPSIKFKGLYTPIALANLGSTPIYVDVSAKDAYSKGQAAYLKRFAQGKFAIKAYPNGGIGMLMLKVNKGMDTDIVASIVQQFNAAAAAKK